MKTWSVSPTKDQKGLGSLLTYFRMLVLCEALGIQQLNWGGKTYLKKSKIAGEGVREDIHSNDVCEAVVEMMIHWSGTLSVKLKVVCQ